MEPLKNQSFLADAADDGLSFMIVSAMRFTNFDTHDKYISVDKETRHPITPCARTDHVGNQLFRQQYLHDGKPEEHSGTGIV
jgi:hypothetical protein